MEFSYKAYCRLIELLHVHGYQICPYKETYDAERVCILRHDVDSSLEKALAFAEFEKKLNVCSTYFILIRSDLYNPFSKESVQLIHRIHALGHDIGLHFDEKYIEESSMANITAVIKTEAVCMETLLNLPINSISMHRPSSETLNADYRIPGLINSYSRKFFREFKYVSDSRRNWREDVTKLICSKNYSKLHILTHPIWYDIEEQGVRDTLLYFISSASRERYHSLRKEFTHLEEFIVEEDIKK